MLARSRRSALPYLCLAVADRFQRVTQAAKNALEDTVIPPELPDDVHEQADLLMRERQAFRDARSTKDCSRPLKGLLIDLNGVVHGEFRDEERIIAADLASFLKKYIAEQCELLACHSSAQ